MIYYVQKKKWGIYMLKSWTPGEMPDREEMKIQLEKTKSSLYDLQMKIKEHKLPVLVLFEGWSAAVRLCAGHQHVRPAPLRGRSHCGISAER